MVIAIWVMGPVVRILLTFSLLLYAAVVVMGPVVIVSPPPIDDEDLTTRYPWLYIAKGLIIHSSRYIFEIILYHAYLYTFMHIHE